MEFDHSREYKQITVVKWIKNSNMVYCYPGLIRFKDLDDECTLIPMRLLATEKFNTSNLSFHGGSELMLNLMLNELIVDDIKLTFYATPTDSYTRVGNLLKETRDELEETRTHGFVTTVGLVLLVVSESTIILHATWRWFKKRCNNTSNMEPDMELTVSPSTKIKSKHTCEQSSNRGGC